MSEEERKLSKEDFVLQAIKNLRKPPYKGIHVKFSSFNSAFQIYFGEESRDTVDQMAKEGKIETRMVRGGPMLYLPGEMPLAEDTLGKILGGK